MAKEKGREERRREFWSGRVKKMRVGAEKGGKGKTNILSPPGTQFAARGCCLYIRTVDRAAAKKKKRT